MSTLAIRDSIATAPYTVLGCVCAPAFFTDGTDTWRVHDDTRLTPTEADDVAAQLSTTASIDGDTPATGDVRLYAGVPEGWTAA